ncbi:MAG: DEAD/DEAH box helicase, partial [bacterium]|nr:DEAD/DEAH box helicase [bacterium]
MPKISEISKIATSKIVKSHVSNPVAKTVTRPDNIGKGVIPVTLAGLGIGVSTLLTDFFKTQDKNFYKLPIDPETQTPYESDCFQTAAAINLYAGNDVLVTAPTGTGKTAIAQYIISKNLEEGKRTFYTTPLKALSNEKFLNFQKNYGKENVGLLTGDTKINPNAPIVIMTTEVYRNMTATEKFKKDSDHEKGIPQNLATVIFDELQYLGDVDRGGIWEQAIMFTPKDVQMLSLSATVGNNKDINNWINSIKENNTAILVEPSKDSKNYFKNISSNQTVLIDVPPENRHVPLQFEIEHVAAEINLPRSGTKKQKIEAKKEAVRKSQSILAKPRDEAYKQITQKLYAENKLPAIYFVFSKKDCKHLLKYLSQTSEILTTEEEREEIAYIIKRYINEGIYLGESLNTDALMKGYAVHNAGLLPSQKTLIEELFQKKLVKLVLATETLSSGINMPAKTTVISSPRKPASTSDNYNDHRRNLTPNEFHQMAGRAGRRGIDTEGYCYALSCNPAQKDFFENIIHSAPNPLQSSLELDYSFITKYLSEFNNEDELINILAKSLYVYNSETSSFDNQKIDELMTNYKIKKEILQKEKYIDENNMLSLKGNLITILNGYEQIPIINLISNQTFA